MLTCQRGSGKRRNGGLPAFTNAQRRSLAARIRLAP
jgi:hypothetical protein